MPEIKKKKVGRRRKFNTPEEMQTVINAYFENCDTNIKKLYFSKHLNSIEVPAPLPYTIEGLCLQLGMDRDSLLNYQKNPNYKEFHDVVNKAKSRVQENLIVRALCGENNPTVTIFNLKNNFGYKDKADQEITGNPIQPIKVIK